MPLIHIVSMQSTQFLHSMNSFDPSISLNTETISFNTIDSFYYRFCPFSFRRKTGNSETPNGMCQNNNFKNVCRRNRFSNLYYMYMYCCFICVSFLSLCECLLRNFALDTALRDFFPFIGYVRVRVFFFTLVSFGKLHHFMLIALMLSFY